jgi:hypothetical protein
MALESRRRAARAITAAAVCLFALGSVVSCGGNASPSRQSEAAGGATKSQVSPSQSSSASGEVRLGCGMYCQSAGSINGAGPTGQPAVTIVSSGTVTADADGYVPVAIRCNLSAQCRGALVLSLGAAGGAKSDLVVDAGATATLGVRLSAQELYFLQVHGPTSVEVTADSGQSPGIGHFDPGAPQGPWVGGVAPVDVKHITVTAPG